MALSPASSRSLSLPFDVTSVPAGTRLLVDEFGDLAVVADPASISVASLSAANPQASMSTGQGFVAKQLPHTVTDGTGNILGKIEERGYLVTAVHAAPTDGDIDAGQAWLWFDQTNGVGATKLMVKAKSADGTVKAATIVLA